MLHLIFFSMRERHCLRTFCIFVFRDLLKTYLLFCPSYFLTISMGVGDPFIVGNIPSARCFHPHPWKFLKKSVPSCLCCWRPQLGLLFLSAGSLAGFLKLIQIPGRAFALPTERIRKPPNDKLVQCENLARAAYVCSAWTQAKFVPIFPREKGFEAQEEGGRQPQL